jgi:hypothetical protein
MSYTYAVKVGSLKEYLTKLKSKELGVPDKINREYLKSIGYTSSNDFPIIRVLQSIDFIDKSDVPTQNLKDFRTEKSRQVVASALKKTYEELFKIYPEPQKRTREDLENFFAKSHPSVKKFTLGLFVDTFKTLCEFADFEAVSVVEKVEAKEAEKVVEVTRTIAQTPTGVTINLNIQLTLPATEDANVYDKIFKALKNNLLSRD